MKLFDELLNETAVPRINTNARRSPGAARRIVVHDTLKSPTQKHEEPEIPIPTLKKELVYETDWATREEAQIALAEYIEEWYDPERQHTSLGFRRPIQYETEVLMLVKTA